MMPFVTEEIWSYLPGGTDRPLVVSPFPSADPALVDAAAEREAGEQIALTRSVRRWRDLVGVAAASVLPARVTGAEQPHELVGRLARLSLDGATGEPLATIGPLEILSSDEVDASQVHGRLAERRSELRAEVERAERRLATDGFVAKAPAEVVEAEREKLEGYRAELEELGEP
jgi:valyl-tRNA synthetase